MVKKFLSLLLVVAFAQSAGGRAGQEKSRKMRFGCHLFSSSKSPRELDFSFTKTLPPSVYGLFQFPRRRRPEPGIYLADEVLKGPVKAVAYRRERGGRVSGKWEQSFDRGGNLTAEVFYKVGGTLGTLPSQYSFEYGPAGRKQSEEGRHESPCIEDYRWVYKYDDARGRLAELQKYDLETGRRVFTLAYTYSADGRTVSEEEVWDNFKLLVREFTLDGEGSVTVTEFSRAEGGSRVSKTFDAAGRLVKVVSYENPQAPAVLRNTYEYGPDGKLARDQSYWPSASSARSYGYDPEGDLTGMRQYATDGTFQHGARHDYEYDARGNWVKKSSWNLSAGQEKEYPGDVLTRSITYY